MTGRSRSATGFSIADTLSRQLLLFGFSVLLARSLAPAEFGLLAMLYVFNGIAFLLSDGGLGAALVQRKHTDPVEESSAFQFNVAVSFAMMLLLWIAAPEIERFYGYPGLTGITRAMSLAVPINALGTVHNALLLRELRIALQLRIGLVSGIISGLVAVAMAWRGYGVWSLVAQALVASALNTTLLWAWHEWRPRHAFRLVAVRPLLRYGGALVASGILDVGIGRLYTLLVGRVYGAAPLGLYMRAVTTQNLPQLTVGAVMRQVVFPVLSGKQAHITKVRRTSRFALRTSMLLQTPCLLGIAATAEWLVPFLFGRAWAESVPILQILCLAGCLYPVSYLNLTILKALGRSDLFLKLELVKNAALIPFLIVAVPFGLLAIAWSQVAGAVFAVLWNVRHTNRLVGYGLGLQFRDALPGLAMGTLMAAIVWGVGRILGQSDGVTLLVLIPLGAVIYTGGLFAFRLIRPGDLRIYLRRTSPSRPDPDTSAIRPRMLVLADSFPNTSESFITDHVRMMAAAGWAVTLLVRKVNAFTDLSTPGSPAIKIETTPVAGVRQALRAAIWILRRPWAWLNPHAWKCALHGSRIAASEAANHHWNVVHAHYGNNGVSALIAKPGWRDRLIVNFHGHDATSVPKRHGWSAYRRVLGTCHAVVHSGFVEARIRQATSMRVHRVTMGVDLRLFSPVSQPSSWPRCVRLLSVGRLAVQKGHAQVIDAVAWLKQHRPDLEVRLAIVGDGPMDTFLRERIRRLALESSVRMLGAMPHSAMPDLYRKHDVMVAASQPTDDGQQEAFGRAAAEAMACGVPVACCNTGGLADTVGGGGIIAGGFDPVSLATSIVEVLDRHPPDTWARKAREQAMKFSIQDMAAGYAYVAALATKERSREQ